MFDPSRGPAEPPDEGITADRRRPRARYFEFRDQHAQELLAGNAERAYAALVKSDHWAGVAQIPARGPAAPPESRLPFRRLRRTQAQAAIPLLSTTAALAKVEELSVTVPPELEASANGCSASRAVAQMLASVARDLVHALVTLPPEQQAAHSAYRQTLRLAAELEGLRDVVVSRTCIDPGACVGIMAVGHLDRRMEDAEVAEVRTVLLQLARAGEAGRPHP